MARYKIPEPDEKILCPYDDTHQVRVSRFTYHLMKCRQNYVGKDYAVCPFNARHELPRVEMRYHMQHCVDSCVIEKDILLGQDEISGRVAIKDFEIKGEEDWSEDIHKGTRKVPQFVPNRKTMQKLSWCPQQPRGVSNAGASGPKQSSAVPRPGSTGRKQSAPLGIGRGSTMLGTGRGVLTTALHKVSNDDYNINSTYASSSKGSTAASDATETSSLSSFINMLNMEDSGIVVKGRGRGKK